MIKSVVLLCCMLAYCGSVCAGQEPGVLKLPAPQTTGGKPLLQALTQRSSARNFSPRQIPLQVLSNLLWAACGINRPGSGGRTVPSAMNAQEIDVYAAMADGLYLYDARQNSLQRVLSEDIRSVTGTQRFVAGAPLNLIFVADYAKMARLGAQKDFYAAVDTGYISQNVYLFCASEGLITVARGWFEPETLTRAMKLRPDQKIILTQTVGYPQ